MAKLLNIELNETDWGQILEGLEIRADSWRRTANYLKEGDIPEGEFFLIEECSNHEEAEKIAARYDEIIRNIRNQI